MGGISKTYLEVKGYNYKPPKRIFNSNAILVLLNITNGKKISKFPEQVFL